MKNKILTSITTILIFFILIIELKAENDFVFESNSLEISGDGNLITAKNGVTINSNDGLKITSNESKYFKIEQKLFLQGDVVVIDAAKNLIIKSNEIEYDRNIEKIISKNETFINIDNNFLINTYDIEYLRLENIFSSNKKTTLTDNFTNKIETNSFKYFVNQKEFKSKNILLTDKFSNRYISKETSIDLKKNEIAAKDIEVYFSNSGGFGEHSRLKGNSMISNNDISIIKKGIFTSCKERDSCPPWSLQANEIKHDKNKKIIEYKNALLKLYDIPVLYFPKFFHPDPTVKRQSGFLIPSIVSSSNSGDSFNIPYFFAIAENRDLTFTPRIFMNNEILLQNEYRHVEKNSNHIADFSIKKLDKSTKSHFFSNSKISFEESNFDTSELEINLEKTSNDTYLKTDNIKSETNSNQSLLNSYVKFDASKQDLSFTGELSVYEDLSIEKNSDKFQYILPNLKLSKFIETDPSFRGDLIFESSASHQKRNTNVSESHLINDLIYNSNSIISKNGLLSNVDLNLKNVSKKGENSSDYSNNFESDNFISTILTTSFPMKKIYENKFESNLTPKISARYSPFKSENLSNLDRSLNITNLFSNNRLGISDSLEGGQSLTIGWDYDLLKENKEKLFSYSLGQVFRDINDDKLPLSSTMQSKSSDVVGRIELNPNDFFELNYDFSADNNLDTMNYNFAEAKLKINNFITSFEFLEENNNIGSDSYFSNDIIYNINSNNTLSYNTRRNRKTNLTEFYNLIYEYRNDCLVAAIEYNKDYYEDRDIKPNEEIFFSITITPFASIESPNVNK
tara:strand:- start:942 stop:3332 length:2391 start_codon:yes stop_codon:yes gene_type:complete